MSLAGISEVQIMHVLSQRTTLLQPDGKSKIKAGKYTLLRDKDKDKAVALLKKAGKKVILAICHSEPSPVEQLSVTPVERASSALMAEAEADGLSLEALAGMFGVAAAPSGNPAAMVIGSLYEPPRVAWHASAALASGDELDSLCAAFASDFTLDVRIFEELLATPAKDFANMSDSHCTQDPPQVQLGKPQGPIGISAKIMQTTRFSLI